MDLQHIRQSNDEKAYAFDHIRRWVVDGVTDGNDVPLGADYGITSLERADEIYFAPVNCSRRSACSCRPATSTAARIARTACVRPTRLIDGSDQGNAVVAASRPTGTTPQARGTK